ncbi:hypothetical protein P879_04770 [Paragonimus westermani]|uniref:Uncharacterized protein n=1 Tax=Paragonimus westermani TaxID=34504 RepID=A0A8T0DNF4_9TREM|nr:hypothetical protein P879_04770 [Paragonimus westermani]
MHTDFLLRQSIEGLLAPPADLTVDEPAPSSRKMYDIRATSSLPPSPLDYMSTSPININPPQKSVPHTSSPVACRSLSNCTLFPNVNTEAHGVVHDKTISYLQSRNAELMNASCRLPSLEFAESITGQDRMSVHSNITSIKLLPNEVFHGYCGGPPDTHGKLKDTTIPHILVGCHLACFKRGQTTLKLLEEWC